MFHYFVFVTSGSPALVTGAAETKLYDGCSAAKLNVLQVLQRLTTGSSPTWFQKTTDGWRDEPGGAMALIVVTVQSCIGESRVLAFMWMSLTLSVISRFHKSCQKRANT